MAVTKLRMRMLEDGRPQYIIAADMGCSSSRLSEYALGKRPIPTQRIYDFVRMWGCNVEDIVGYEEVEEVDEYD